VTIDDTVSCGAVLYSDGMVRTGGRHLRALKLFSYVAGQPVPGGEVQALRCDTNVPKAGTNGLPKGWSLVVERVSFLCDWHLGSGLGYWLDKGAMARLRVNMLDILEVSLGHALRQGTMALARPLHLPENMAYEAELELPEEPLAAEASMDYWKASITMTDLVEGIAARAFSVLPSIASRGSAMASFGRRMMGLGHDLQLVLHHLPDPEGAKVWVVLEGAGRFTVI